MAHRTAGGLPTNPGLHSHEKPPSWLTQIDWEPQLWLWMKHSSVSKKYDVSIGGSRLECDHLNKTIFRLRHKGRFKVQKVIEGYLSCDDKCMKTKFYCIIEPFHISRFFVRNHMTNSNLSTSRFCSKLNF